VAVPEVVTVGIVLHHGRPEATQLAVDAARWLIDRGHALRLSEEDAEITGLEEHGVPLDELVPGLDLVVSLGGDGTMLRTVDLVAEGEVPVIGVNLGQLGYLTEVEPRNLIAALGRFLAGDFHVQERMRLTVRVDAPSCDEHRACEHPALNEAVLGKTPTGQIVRVRVSVDGEEFTTYHTDGIIIASPTGSTAYAWSAGGPIVAPVHRALLLTPVAPHMLFDRSLVLPPTSVIRLEVVADRQASLSVDGRNLALLEAGDAIECTAATHDARVVQFEPRSFLDILKAKFGLNDR
jgi:NAD+ kinase